MKARQKIWGVFLAWVWCFSAHLPGAQEAQMSLHCISLRFHPATAATLGVNYTFSLATATGPIAGGNGELAPLFNAGPTTHGCRFRLISEIFPEPFVGFFFLNLPPGIDANGNGVNDFFEVRQPVAPISSQGIFVDDLTEEEGKVTATWNRATNSSSGTCQLRMESSYLNLTFNHAFDLLEWSGQLRYASTVTNVTGTVDLVDASPSSNRLAGPIVFTKPNQIHLALRAGSWTDQNSLVWSNLATLTREPIERDGTNYFGFLDFTDGDPTSGDADFTTWILWMGDTNDANRNGIPDLSDLSPVSAAPTLSLSYTEAQLWLTIQGDAGGRYTIEHISRIGQTNWATLSSLTLTNSPQTILLPPPPERTRFWRLRSP